MRSLTNVLFLSFLCVFCVSTPMLFAQGPCESDKDCDDGLFCNGTEYCDAGSCVVVSACPPAIDGCVERNAFCDEKRDRCVDFLDDSLCAADEICAPSGDCFIPGQDVGSPLCAQVQADAQDAVVSGGPYKNHGQMVRTAAHVVSDYEEAGMITEECSSCIVSQFARRIPIEEQEPCGLLCPVDLRGIFPAPADVTEATFLCWAPAAVAVTTLDNSGTEAAGIVFNSTMFCTNVGTGPGFCYQINSDDLAGVQMTVEEMKGCDQMLRAYAQELDDLGTLGGDDLDLCPPVEEPEP